MACVEVETGGVLSPPSPTKGQPPGDAQDAPDSPKKPSQLTSASDQDDAVIGKATIADMTGAPTLAMQASHWITDPHVWFRHPIARLIVAWAILAQDFYIYGEDPVNDSHADANFPGMGHILGLISLHAAETVGLGFLRLFFVILSLFVAFIASRFLLVKLLRAKLKWMLFAGGQGAVIVFIVMGPLCMLIGAMMYNLCIPSSAAPVNGTSLQFMLLFGSRSLEFRHVNQSFQTFSGAVDFLAILGVTDQILQDESYYPNFVAPVKRFWRSGRGWVRVVIFWLVVLVATIVVGALVYNTGKESGDIRWTDTVVGGQTENSRTFLASLIILSDLLTTAQDWAFPVFKDPIDLEVKTLVPGFLGTEVTCGCVGRVLTKVFAAVPPIHEALPKCCREILPERKDFARISVNGKCLTYGPLLVVMCVDLMCARTQVNYLPEIYGQYVDRHDDRIWAISDREYLARAWGDDGVLKHKDMITYEARRNTSTGKPLNDSAATDHKLNARFVDSVFAKYLPLGLSLLWIVLFVAAAAKGNKVSLKEIMKKRLSDAAALDSGACGDSRGEDPEVCVYGDEKQADGGPEASLQSTEPSCATKSCAEARSEGAGPCGVAAGEPPPAPAGAVPQKPPLNAGADAVGQSVVIAM